MRLNATSPEDDENALTGRGDFGVRLQNRDPEALDRFFSVWFPLIHGYVRRQVADDHVAEDLTQDIFLNIHRALESYDPERALQPWVYRIATNKIRDHWRARHKHHLNPTDEEDESIVDRLSVDETRPDAAMVQSELSDEVLAAVHRLPESLRTTILMRVYEGSSFEAIGRVVGRNATAVRKRYSRALGLLRETLEGTQELHLGSA